MTKKIMTFVRDRKKTIMISSVLLAKVSYALQLSTIDFQYQFIRYINIRNTYRYRSVGLIVMSLLTLYNYNLPDKTLCNR